jgi:PAS domain S-box-containing protein
MKNTGRILDMSTDTHAWVCQQIVDHAQEAMILADGDGVIRLWNAGAETIFGYRAEEAVGRTLDLIIPTQLRARHWAGYRQVMATGVTRYSREVLAVPALRKDGTRLSLEFTIILLRDAAGDLLGPAALIRDVTARWQRDQALKERLAALEAQVRGTHGPAGDERRDNAT